MPFKKIHIRIIQFIEYFLFRLICFILNLLPFPLAMKIGQFFGRLLYRFLGRFRKIALENLREAFKDKSEQEIETIAKASFENLGYFAIEFIRIPHITKNLNQYVTIQNEQSVAKAMKLKKGLVLIVSHFGNWEWMAVGSGAKAKEMGLKINAVARALGNPFLYQYATKKLRGATGLHTIDKRGAAREAMKHLDQNEIVCILIDQHERHGSVPVPYFGRIAWTTSLSAVMALKKGTPVIPVFSYRRKNKSTLVELGEPFSIIKSGNYEADLIANTLQYVQEIEKVVTKRPGDWLWMHARWRSSRTGKLDKHRNPIS